MGIQDPDMINVEQLFQLTCFHLKLQEKEEEEPVRNGAGCHPKHVVWYAVGCSAGNLDRGRQRKGTGFDFWKLGFEYFITYTVSGQ